MRSLEFSGAPLILQRGGVHNWSWLHEEAAIKPQQCMVQRASGSAIHPHTEGDEPQVHRDRSSCTRDLILCISSTGCSSLSFIIALNKLVNVLPWILRVTLENYGPQRGDPWNLPPTPGWTEAQMIRCNWQLKGAGRASGATESFPCGIWCDLWVDRVRTELNCRIPRWCHTELLLVEKNPQNKRTIVKNWVSP